MEFTPRERETYNELKDRAVMSIDKALEQSTDVSRSGVYVNMLQQIESLRLFCNLGLHYHTRHDTSLPLMRPPPEVTEWASVAQQTFKSHLEMASVSCSLCKSIQGLTDMENLFDETPQQKKPLFSRCLRYVCAECASSLSRNGRTFQCGHNSACPAVSVSTSIYSLEDASDAVPEPQVPLGSFPSKVIALVTDIRAQPLDVKWCVSNCPRSTMEALWLILLLALCFPLGDLHSTSWRRHWARPPSPVFASTARFRRASGSPLSTSSRRIPLSASSC